jgi:L-ascorbate metabolism protein UlaG (beta-lactamase superfamily)
MPDNATQITLIGGPTVLIEFAGLRFLTDPTFDDHGADYTRNGVTLVKLTDPVMGIDAIGKVDAVLLSHDQHADNLDHSGRELLDHVPLVLTTKIGASRIGGTARGLADWESHVITSPSGSEVRITAAPGRHGPAGIEPIAGDVTGFIIEDLTGAHGTLYVTGDTVYYEGVAEVARRFKPASIIAFAGAARVRGPFDLTMSINDLLDTARAFPDATIIPVHTEGWAHFTQSTAEIAGVFDAFGLAHRLRTAGKGEVLSLD